MKKEPIHDYVRRRLREFAGHHNRIARETGVPQSSISRMHQGGASPTLASVQPLIDWFDKQDAGIATVKPKKSGAGRITAAKPGRVTRRAGVGAPTTLAQ